MKPFVPNAHFVKFSHFQKKEKGHDPLLERHPHMMIGAENDSLIEQSTNPAYVIFFSSCPDFLILRMKIRDKVKCEFRYRMFNVNIGLRRAIGA